MTLTTAQALALVSEYTVADSGGDITTSQLTNLEALLADEIAALNNGRFSGDSLARFTAYLVLNIWDSRSGKGSITEEKIKDYSYKSKVGTSSPWMDAALQMISVYDAGQFTDVDYTEGAEREDIYIENVTENYSDGDGGYEY